MQAEGEGYFRAALASEDHDGFEALRGDVFGEWGASPLWTLTAKYERVDFDTSQAFDSEGWRVTARRRLWQSGAFSAAGEIGLLEGAAIGGFRGCESLGAELSAGLGYSISSHLGDVYAGGTLMRREHEGGCFHDRFEGVLGHTDPEGWIWTLQLWSERGKDDRSDKAELMLSRRWGRFEPGIGYRKELSGEFEESAMVVSLAVRP